LSDKEFIRSVVDEYLKKYAYDDAPEEGLEMLRDQVAVMAATFLICQEKLKNQG
jgi:hypothetical protein